MAPSRRVENWSWRRVFLRKTLVNFFEVFGVSLLDLEASTWTKVVAIGDGDGECRGKGEVWEKCDSGWRYCSCCCGEEEKGSVDNQEWNQR